MTAFSVFLAALRSQPRLPFPLTDFAQVSSRPVNHQPPALLREREHPLACVPSNAATRATNDSRALGGASHSARDFVRLLDERNIQLTSPGTAALNPQPVLQVGQGLVLSGVEPSSQLHTLKTRHSPVGDDLGSLSPSSPPRSSPFPGQHPPSPHTVSQSMFTFPPPAPRGQEYSRTMGLAGPSQTPLYTLPTRMPVSSPSPPPTQPVAVASRPPAQSERYQPSVPFRFGLVHPKPASLTDSEESTTSSSPPALAPTAASSRWPLQSERPHARVPLLRLARFSPKPPSWPLQREAVVFLSSPEQAAPAPAQIQAGAAAPRQATQTQDEPSRPLVQTPKARSAMQPPSLASRTGESRRRPTMAMQIRDTADPRFLMPLPPAETRMRNGGKSIVNLHLKGYSQA